MKRPLSVILALLVTTSLNAKPLRAKATWVGTWAASQQIPEPPNALPSGIFADVTLRQTVHVSCAGSVIRVHISNAFGTRALHVTSARIARPAAPGSSTIDLATDHALLFNGSPDILIPPAAEYISDPVDFALAALSDLAVSIHIDSDPGQQTGHPGSRQTSFYTAGDRTAESNLPSAKLLDHWYFLSGVDVLAPSTAFSIVALGDSITDGHGATTNGNDRWTDILAQRLQASDATRNIGVLNQGIGGNHLLTDGLGPNALARFDRDVLAQTDVRFLILLEGINDLGGLERTAEAPRAAHDALVRRILGAYQQIIDRAHAHGIVVYGATITPDTGSDYYHPTPASEVDRQHINAWIRHPGHFDSVIDFDKAVADPARPTNLLSAYDSGDYLHPNPAGYSAMARSIDLTLFVPRGHTK